MDNLPKKTLNCLVNEPRLRSLEEGQRNMCDKFDTLVKQNSEQFELLAKLDTIVEFMVEDKNEVRKEKSEERKTKAIERREQREINKEITETLRNMNINLVGLNMSTEQIEARVIYLENQKSKSKIDILQLITDAVKTLITMGITGGVIWLLVTILSAPK